MTARQQAIQDIRAELKNESKSFIAYRTELNRQMRNLVNEHLKAQKQVSKKKR